MKRRSSPLSYTLSISHAHFEFWMISFSTPHLLCGCKRLSMCASDRPVSSSLLQKITVEWESCNLITYFIGERHMGMGWAEGGDFVLGECFSRPIRENGVNDWKRRSRRGEEKEQRAVLRGWWRAAKCQRITILCLTWWIETLFSSSFYRVCVCKKNKKKETVSQEEESGAESDLLKSCMTQMSPSQK